MRKTNDAKPGIIEQDDQATDEEDESYQEAEDNDQEENDMLGGNYYLPEKWPD
jgi:hypothetical protein